MTKELKPFEIKVNCTYGAPIGRSNEINDNLYDEFKNLNNLPSKFHPRFNCVKVPLDQGYDRGGAYWGIGQPLYCVFYISHIEGTTEDYRGVFYIRADNREQAKIEAIKYFNFDVKFYR